MTDYQEFELYGGNKVPRKKAEPQVFATQRARDAPMRPKEVSAPNDASAKLYKQLEPTAAKTLLSDGSMVSCGKEILPPNARRAELFKSHMPQVAKWRLSDGSVIDPVLGTVIEPPSPDGAKQYRDTMPRAAKFLMADGSVTQAIQNI